MIKLLARMVLVGLYLPLIAASSAMWLRSRDNCDNVWFWYTDSRMIRIDSYRGVFACCVFYVDGWTRKTNEARLQLDHAVKGDDCDKHVMVFPVGNPSGEAGEIDPCEFELANWHIPLFSFGRGKIGWFDNQTALAIGFEYRYWASMILWLIPGCLYAVIWHRGQRRT